MKETWVLGIRSSDRMHDVTALQEVLTKFGCSIRTRLGLHENDGDQVADGGIVILELAGNVEEFMKLENELLKLDGLTVKKMVL
jgi:hypothetical protein